MRLRFQAPIRSASSVKADAGAEKASKRALAPRVRIGISFFLRGKGRGAWGVSLSSKKLRNQSLTSVAAFTALATLCRPANVRLATRKT